MPLAPGTTLSFYKILGPLGAGAMGEVYRARDTRLERDVAIKVLPTEFASNEERLRRFEREARTLASLNHPNVAHIHGVERVDGVSFLVLELVSGDTLESRLAHGPLPPDDCFDICRQIAEGLEAAHEAGIVHRDLKPANVRLTPEGVAKVLDFGLAKSLRVDSGTNPADSSLATEDGRLLGTPTYMAPEQARGKSIDRRIDVWAFGCVLYECLAGKRAFPGSTVSDVLAAVIEREPDWSALPTATPLRVRELLRRCLTKDVRQRLRDVGEARIVLESPHDPAGSPLAGRTTSAKGRILLWSLAGAAVVMTGLWARSALTPAPAPRVTRVSVTVPQTDAVGAVFQMGAIALAPDARTLAYCAQRDGNFQLFVRRLDEAQSTLIPGTQGAHNPFFSPDGQWVAFFAGEKLKKVFVRGGEPLDLMPASQDRGGTWLEDGSIVVAPNTADALCRISASGGPVERITELDASRKERTHRWPCALPGGEWILFTVGTTDRPADYDRAAVSVFSLKTKERRDVFTGASMAKYSSSGHLILGLHSTLYAAPFNLAALKVTGPELPVVNDVAGAAGSGNVQFDVARDGTLAYMSDVPEFNIRELVWMDRSGNAQTISAPPQPYMLPHLSSDGKRVLVCIGPQLLRSDIWTFDLEHEKLNRLTFDQRSSMPVWAPGGTEFAYWCLSGGIRLEIKGIAQGATPRVLVANTRVAAQPSAFSVDGKDLIFDFYGDTESDIMFVPIDGSGEPQVIAKDPSAQWGAVMSPDGRWVAFVSNESGRDEVYVRSWSHPAAKWQVSNSGGLAPVWSRNGTELFYMRGAMLVAVPVDLKSADFSPGAQHDLFAMPPAQGVPKEVPNYDVANDGHFLVTRLVHPDAALQRVDLILNWAEELRRLVPAE